jgi:polyphosphate kinase 2
MTAQIHTSFKVPSDDPEKPGKNKGKDRKAKRRDGHDKLPRKVYEAELRKLQVELCHLQEWVKKTGTRVIIILEGRDTAGKSGFIRVMRERVSPRVFRVVALTAPNEERRAKLFLQRYVEQFPLAGEVVIFDRSWYNRAGVERVMGFASEEQVSKFLQNVPKFERWIADAGIIIVKLWLEIGKDEQERRFRKRIGDPMRQWKLSSMDLQSYSRWYDYSRARDEMFAATDHDAAPWYVLPSNDKKKARLNGLNHVLSRVPYKRAHKAHAELPKRSQKHRYDDALDFEKIRLVPPIY